MRVNNVGTTDTLDLYNAAGATKLNVMAATQALRLQADWVSATANFNATMSDVTGNTVDGHDRHADRHRRRCAPASPRREHDLEPVDRRHRRGRQRRHRDLFTETGVVDRDF